MCGIAGFCDFTADFLLKEEDNKSIAKKMGQQLNRRGPDANGVFLGEHVAFAHTRLAVIDLIGGAQPMKKEHKGYGYVITYNGELYNTEEIRHELISRGYEFTTNSDTEVLLTAYIEFGKKCVDYLNGIFAFAVWDSYHRSCFLCRDRFGVKPLFYATKGDTLIFSSELKGLFQYPNIKPVIDKYGLCELFGLGPARSPGCGVYRGIHELPPGHAIYLDYNGLRRYCYFSLEAAEHTENYEETVEHTRDILFDAIRRQLVSDVPICTLLSGGLDSSVVSAVAAEKCHKEGNILDTYSFDYVDNKKYFTSSSFQPSMDRPYVDIMVNAIRSNHTYLECDPISLVDCLYEAVHAKDLPGMADVDSSLLYFARQMKKNHTVSLSGECADEIFGGYPWFRDPDVLNQPIFPWSKNLDFRNEIIAKGLLEKLPMDEYVAVEYQKTMERVSKLDTDSDLMKRHREISYLNTAWFMTTLLDRKDRMTMYSGLEVRVPFADHRLVQYLYNVPWEYKYHNGEVKSLLKDAAKEILPDEVIHRKKCPYPKTYHPEYESRLKEILTGIIASSAEPIHELINRSAMEEMMFLSSDYGRPWFGQLMATPQLYAYLIQMNYWLKEYNVDIVI